MENHDTSEQIESMNPFLLGFLMVLGIMLLIGVISKEVSASYKISGIDLADKISLKE